MLKSFRNFVSQTKFPWLEHCSIFLKQVSETFQNLCFGNLFQCMPGLKRKLLDIEEICLNLLALVTSRVATSCPGFFLQPMENLFSSIAEIYPGYEVGRAVVFCTRCSFSSSHAGKPYKILLHESSLDVMNAWINLSQSSWAKCFQILPMFQPG